MSRSRNRSHGTMPIFDESMTLGLRIVQRMKVADVERLVNARRARYVVEEQTDKVVGAQVCQPNRISYVPLLVKRSCPAISRSEVLANAGTAFKAGKSRTMTMTEAERSARVHPLTKRLLPAEDFIERATAKVRAFSGPVEKTTPDRSTMVYPCGMVTGQYKRATA